MQSRLRVCIKHGGSFWRRSMIHATAVSLSVLMFAGCSQNSIREERNLGPKPISERAKDLKSAPEPTPAEYVARGDAAFKEGNWDKAIVEYVNSLTDEPDSPHNLDTLAKIARAHLEAGNVETAESTFRQVLAIRSDDLDAREGLGLSLMNLRRHDEAAAEFMAIMVVDSKRWRTLNGLAIIHDVEGRMADARPLYEQALALVPYSSEVLNNLGYSHYLSGDFAEAGGYFRKAIDADRKNAKAWSNLGLLLTRERKYQEALGAFSKIMDKPKALNSVGYVCMLADDFACAEQYFSQALAASPNWYVEAHDNLTRVRTLKLGQGAASGSGALTGSID